MNKRRLPQASIGLAVLSAQLVLAGLQSYPAQAATPPALLHIVRLSQTPSAFAPMRAAAPDPERIEQSAAVPTPEKRKVGFLAAAGLTILSLLILATGLALLRAFRQR